MSDVILCNLSDANSEIKEARLLWAYQVLIDAGVPEETLLFDDIRDFRVDMDDLGIEVELKNGEEVDIYKLEWFETEYEAGWLPPKKEHLIAQWKKPTRIMKVDENGRDVYYEIHLNEWSIFKTRSL